MRIAVTVEAGGAPADVLIRTDDVPGIDRVAEAIRQAVGVPAGELVIPAKPGVARPGGDGLAASGLRDGVRLGLGRPPTTEPEATGGPQLHVVGGPAAGTILELPTGDHDIGRVAGLRLSWADDKLSRRHARVHVDAERITVADLGSSNGTFLDGERLTADPVEVQPGQMLSLGDSLVQIRPPRRLEAAVEPGEAGWLNFLRPPRILPWHEDPTVEVPKAPAEPTKRRIPWVGVLAPLAMGAVMVLVMHSARYALFMLLSPVMMLFNWLSDRRSGAADYKKSLAEYETKLAQARKDLAEAVASEQARLRSELPDPPDTWLTCRLPGKRLWERRRDDPDWLTLRLGSSAVPSTVKLTGADDGADHVLADVPVGVRLPDQPVVGIAGPDEAVDGLLRWVVLQVAAYHPTRDVEMSFVSGRGGPEWAWLQWLPHLRPDDDSGPLARAAFDEEARTGLVGSLAALVKARQDIAAQQNHEVSFPAHVVVVHGYRHLRYTAGLGTVLDDGPAVGVFAVCCDAEERFLPEECTATCVVDRVPPGQPAVRARLAQSGQPAHEHVLLDLVQPGWCEQAARELSPLIDIGADSADQALPGSSRLLDVLGLDSPTAEQIVQRWRDVGRTTEVVVGEAADGPFRLDMRKDGPHGLVAGTTGSGKSEFLQTLVASLAVVNRPDEMNYVLVDYKGGAAFKDCNKLPHTVGLVTDLDGHLTTRALESLAAELRRREHQLAQADAKDIEDYQKAMSPGDQPLPRLLIIVDEFASLAQELPDFITGLGDIARRGRSLGVHLILATQRPAGVITGEIKSNTNLRVALRVTDASDSSDVLDSPQAAQISKSTPGRAYARLGSSSLIAFQSSRVGGRPPGSVDLTAIDVLPYAFADLPRPAASATGGDDDGATPTDLAHLVAACRKASQITGIHSPPPPWLPPLDPVITLDDVLEQFPDAAPTPDRLVLPLGLTDIPNQQCRAVAALDLDHGGHLAVAGSTRSGRSTALRAVAGAIGRFLSPADVHVYGVDCGNNALLPLTGLPHVGAVVSRDQQDRLNRLTSRLQQLIVGRQQQLAVAGFADVGEQRLHTTGQQRLPYIVVLFDAWEGFVQVYDGIDGGRLVDTWRQIIQEGAAAGVRIVMTGDRSLVLGRMGSLFEDKLLLRMPDPSDYAVIGMPFKAVPSTVPDGRGFRSGDLRETQIALLADDPAGTAQVRALHEIARAATDRHGDLPPAQRPFRVDVLPNRFTRRQIPELSPSPLATTELAIAVGGDTLSLRGLDTIDQGPAWLIAGSAKTGRSTALVTLGGLAAERGWQVVTVTPRKSPLRDLTGPTVHGPFDTSSEEAEVTVLLTRLTTGDAPSLVLVDDVELVGTDGWLPDLLAAHIGRIRDTGHALAAAATPVEIGNMYRGPVVQLKRCRAGLLLSPQSTTDADLFGISLPRSAYAQALPPGGGYLVKGGAVERVQTIWPQE